MSSSEKEPTTPPVPEAARGVFPSDRLSLAERYAALLATDGVVRGLIGPREAPRLWDRHLLNCAALAEALPERSTVCDIGSGAGLPGLVLAIARPDLRVTLVEPLLRRTTFLQEAVDALGLDVEVVRGRAEDLHGDRTFDVVTSRAVAPLDRLLRWSMPLVAVTGSLVAMKGSSAVEEVRSAREVLGKLGCAEPEVLELGVGRIPSPTRAVRVSWADPATVGWRPAPPAGGNSEKSARRRRRRPDRGGQRS